MCHQQSILALLLYFEESLRQIWRNFCGIRSLNGVFSPLTCVCMRSRRFHWSNIVNSSPIVPLHSFLNLLLHVPRPTSHVHNTHSVYLILRPIFKCIDS